jgi:ABC-type polysaccharide/polyol phosphate export permease
MFYQEFKKMMLTTIMPFIKRITLYELLVNLYDFRNLLLELTSKNIVARYKQSFLGLAWAIILPVATTALFTMIKIFINIPSEGIPYPVFFLSALIPWSLFSNQVTVASGSIVLNEALIKKIYFPREVLTVSAVFTRILDWNFDHLNDIFQCSYFILLFVYSPLVLDTDYICPFHWVVCCCPRRVPKRFHCCGTYCYAVLDVCFTCNISS